MFCVVGSVGSHCGCKLNDGNNSGGIPFHMRGRQRDGLAKVGEVQVGKDSV